MADSETRFTYRLINYQTSILIVDYRSLARYTYVQGHCCHSWILECIISTDALLQYDTMKEHKKKYEKLAKKESKDRTYIRVCVFLNLRPNESFDYPH